MRWLLLSLIALAWPCFARADAIEDFYRGKTLNLMIGSGAGGGVDQVSRAVARHLGKHVPGNPTVVPRNMAGAGGLQVLNHIQSVAPEGRQHDRDRAAVAGVRSAVHGQEAKATTRCGSNG